MVDIATVEVPTTWIKLDDLLDIETSASFSFNLEIDYRIQNVGSTAIVFKDSTSAPTSSSVVGGLLPPNPALLWWYRVGVGTLYVRALTQPSVLYIGERG